MAGRPELRQRRGVAASRDVAGGDEEEILGEGVRVRVLARLARVPTRWEVVEVRRGAEMVGFRR
jgi:hypothetical protein